MAKSESDIDGLAAGPHRASLAVVYATVFLDILGFGIILPFLPYYAEHLGATGLGLGLLFTAYSATQMVGAAVLGRLSDRFGRRPILLLSLLGSALSMALCGFAQTLVGLCLARALAGLFGGSIATAQAYVADVTEDHERAKYMGLVGASIGLGFVVGPALGVAIRGLGYSFAGAAFTAAGLALVNFLFGLARLRESTTVRSAMSARRPGPAQMLRALARPGLTQVLLAAFLTTFAFVGMETTFAFLGAVRFAFDERSFGLVLVYVGVVIVIVQGGLIGRLTRRFGVRPIAVVGGSAMALALAGIGLGTTLPVALAALGLLAVGQGLVSPSLSTLNSLTAAAGEQGWSLGAGQSLAAAARGVGPVMAGWLYDQSGRIGGLPAGALPYLLAAGAALLAAILVASIRLAEPA